MPWNISQLCCCFYWEKFGWLAWFRNHIFHRKEGGQSPSMGSRQAEGGALQTLTRAGQWLDRPHFIREPILPEECP